MHALEQTIVSRNNTPETQGLKDIPPVVPNHLETKRHRPVREGRPAGWPQLLRKKVRADKRPGVRSVAEDIGAIHRGEILKNLFPHADLGKSERGLRNKHAKIRVQLVAC